MATKKITELTNVTSVQDTDLMIVETSEGTRSIKKSDLVSDVITKVNGISIPTELSQLTDDPTHRLVTDTEKATWNAKASNDHYHGGAILTPLSIELTPSASSNNGGYIDFHWNGSDADYTSRIIENASGSLYMGAQVEVANPPMGYSRVRNINAGTTDLVAGSTALTTGAIYIVYE